ncbi:MAG: glycosyltransferase N-terminal domain-containing protein, partial [Pseudomonadota bacterium]|nr:glycosyltransferase N-terminal domain-containing protein [Pseudomonadota bacterium]
MHRRQGSLEGLGERLGWGWPRAQSQAGSESRTSWFHGASVGEVQMLVPLIQTWCKRYPGTGLLLTTMTLTGRQTAKRLFPDARVVLLPLDLPGLWPLFFRRFRPKCLIIAETELWPNLLHYTKRQG